MSQDERISRALRELKEQITKEDDPNKLHRLVIEINALLDIIAEKVGDIERRRPPLSN